MRRVWTMVAVVLVLAGAAGSLGAMPQGEGSIESWEEALPGLESVEIATSSVEIRVYEAGGSPRVEARLHELRELVVENRGGRYRIEVRTPPSSIWTRGAEYVDVYTPAGTELVAQTSSGDIRVENVRFRQAVRLGSSSGEITVRDLDAVLAIATSSGDVELRNVSGSIELSSSSGDFSLNEVAGLRRVSTSSGTLRGRDVVLVDDLAFSSSSGDLDLSLANAASELSFVLTASSGDLQVNGTRGEDRLATGSGPIRVEASSSSGDLTFRTR